MDIKRWWAMFFAALLTVAAAICALNIVVDPFGVFGDSFFDWYAFNMTKNPKAAKISYLNANYENYNAYIIGPSGSSSFLPEKLNEYTGLNWYNTFNYGADMAYTTQLARYIADNFEAEQFLLILPYISAAQYDMPPKDATEWYSPYISGGFSSWFKFLFANPRYSISKIRDYNINGYLQENFDVFIPQSGVYDKSSRDVEPIGALSDYAPFENDKFSPQSLVEMENCMKDVKALKALCDEKGIELTIIVPPSPRMRLDEFSKEDIAEFYSRLSEIADFYDYANFVPDEPRFYYDESHFRNNVGNMVLADIFADDSIYIYKEGDDPDSLLAVLLYHHITTDGAGDSVSVADFKEDMGKIHESGYTPVSLKDIENYVYRGAALPQKSVLIRFDDGYTSNYELAYPILKEFGYKAAIFAIGVSVGKDTYKDSAEPITPHFSFEQAKEMIDSGFIEVQSHTYDMHQVERLDGDDCRKGVLQKDNENEADYIEILRADFARSRYELEEGTGHEVFALAYPYGLHNKLSDVVLSQMGVRITFTTEPGINTIVKGLPQSLFNLKICEVSGLF